MYVNNNNIKTIARVEIIHGGKKLLLVSKPKHIGSISCKNKSMSSNFHHNTIRGGSTVSLVKKRTIIGPRKKSKVVFRFRTQEIQFFIFQNRKDFAIFVFFQFTKIVFEKNLVTKQLFQNESYHNRIALYHETNFSNELIKSQV